MEIKGKKKKHPPSTFYLFLQVNLFKMLKMPSCFSYSFLPSFVYHLHWWNVGYKQLGVGGTFPEHDTAALLKLRRSGSSQYLHGRSPGENIYPTPRFPIGESPTPQKNPPWRVQYTWLCYRKTIKVFFCQEGNTVQFIGLAWFSILQQEASKAVSDKLNIFGCESSWLTGRLKNNIWNPTSGSKHLPITNHTAFLYRWLSPSMANSYAHVRHMTTQPSVIGKWKGGSSIDKPRRMSHLLWLIQNMHVLS